MTDEAIAASMPMHRLRFPGNPRVQSAAFAADGQTIFVDWDDQAVNIWEVAVYYWPETLGSATAIIVIVCSFALWRIMRRRRLVGEPHCRRCNYCLRGVISGRCPECGRETERPIIGKSTWRRGLPWSLPLGIALLGYGSLWAFQMPRAGSASAWINWWSYDVAGWAQSKGVSLTRWVTNVDRVVEIDVTTGETLRTLITRPNRMDQWFPLTVTPDGGGLLMTLDRDDRLGLVSTRSGRVIRTLARGDSSWTWGAVSRWTQIAGFDDDGRTAYVVMFDVPASRTELLAWDLQTGESSLLFECDAEMVDIPYLGSPKAMPRRFFAIPGPGPTRFLQLPSIVGAYDDRITNEILVRGPEDLKRITMKITAEPPPFADPVFTSDGSRVFLGSKKPGSGLAVFDLVSGRRLQQWHPPVGHTAGHGNRGVPQRGPVIVARSLRIASVPGPTGVLTSTLSGPEAFLVGDSSSERWIGRYTRPSEAIRLGEIWISPDARFFATAGVIPDSSVVGRYQQELLIYDLRSLPHDIDLSTSQPSCRSR